MATGLRSALCVGRASKAETYSSSYSNYILIRALASSDMGKEGGAGFPEYECFQLHLDSIFSNRNNFLLPILLILRREIPEEKPSSFYYSSS